MASDLISKDMAYAVVKDYFKQKIDKGEHEVDVVDCNADLQVLLFEQPTVDAVEVVHGRWDDSFDGITPYCTACGRSHNCINRTPNYCPNCGAKMDGGDKE